MGGYVLTVQPSLGAGPVVVTDHAGNDQGTFRRPARPLRGCLAVLLAAVAFLLAFVAFVAAAMTYGQGLQRAADRGDTLATATMVATVALAFAVPISVAFVVANLVYPRLWYVLHTAGEPAEKTLTVRERASSWLGTFTVRDHDGAVLAVIHRDLPSREYRASDGNGEVFLTLSGGKPPKATRLGLFWQALGLFAGAYRRKHMGHRAFMGGQTPLVLFRPGEAPLETHARVASFSETGSTVRIGFTDPEPAEREKAVALALGVIILCS
jgi:hypothetical protein